MKIKKIIKLSLIILLSSLVLASANNCQEECWRDLGRRLVDCLDYMGTNPLMTPICQGEAGIAYGICLSFC